MVSGDMQAKVQVPSLLCQPAQTQFRLAISINRSQPQQSLGVQEAPP
jgi:hypothetical protein